MYTTKVIVINSFRIYHFTNKQIWLIHNKKIPFHSGLCLLNAFSFQLLHIYSSRMLFPIFIVARKPSSSLGCYGWRIQFRLDHFTNKQIWLIHYKKLHSGLRLLNPFSFHLLHIYSSRMLFPIFIAARKPSSSLSCCGWRIQFRLDHFMNKQFWLIHNKKFHSIVAIAF